MRHLGGSLVVVLGARAPATVETRCMQSLPGSRNQVSCSRVRGSRLSAAAGALALLAVACAPAVAPHRGSGPTLYVSDETQGTVVVIDGATGAIEARIAVGKRPRGLKLSADGTRLFVALSGSPIAGPGVDESTLPPADRSADGIGVVDLATRKVVRMYPSGQDPETFDVSPDGTRLYVSNEETAEMSVLDLSRGDIVARVPVCGEPEGVTVAPGGAVVYVTCEANGMVAAVDTKTLALLTRIPAGARPRAIAVTSDGRTIFVTAENAAAVSVIDAASHEARGAIALTMPDITAMPPRPMGAALSPDGASLFVSNGRARSVAVIDVATRTPRRMIPQVGARPWGIAVSPDGRRLYTANGPSGDVSFIDVAAGTVERRVATGGSPWGVVAR
jgi:YVTN family beta-propeller protein